MGCVIFSGRFFAMLLEKCSILLIFSESLSPGFLNHFNLDEFIQIVFPSFLPSTNTSVSLFLVEVKPGSHVTTLSFAYNCTPTCVFLPILFCLSNIPPSSLQLAREALVAVLVTPETCAFGVFKPGGQSYTTSFIINRGFLFLLLSLLLSFLSLV